eukprot:TRINITY_DN29897_c0_g1_i1.p1 TRINITY_DN29897_c0_g1~~TRINITY_DN29897_c0_g1_i1.p1  ORF type:complete len:234 (+),score=31.91 TRINITY_DN29897_c0_g1_i1:86-787(+)
MGCCVSKKDDEVVTTDAELEKRDGDGSEGGIPPIVKFKVAPPKDNEDDGHDTPAVEQQGKPEKAKQQRQKDSFTDSPDTADISNLVAPPTLFCTLSSEVQRSTDEKTTPTTNPLSLQGRQKPPQEANLDATLEHTLEHPSISPSCSYNKPDERHYDERRIRLEKWLDGRSLSPVPCHHSSTEVNLILTADNVDKNRHILQKIAKSAFRGQSEALSSHLSPSEDVSNVAKASGM